jgi:hypothetical protein
MDRKEAMKLVQQRVKLRKNQNKFDKGNSRKVVKNIDLNFQSGKLDPEYKSIGGKVFKGR